jgi:hypothetical protein
VDFELDNLTGYDYNYPLMVNGLNHEVNDKR